MPGGAPSIPIPYKDEKELAELKKKSGVHFNEEKQTLFRVATMEDVNATFYDRDTPGETSFAGKVIREPVVGKSYPAIIISEEVIVDGRGFKRTHGRLSVYFGRLDGWKDVRALLRDGGHLGKQSYTRGYNKSKE